MKYDTILLTGDKKASKSVFGMNKSLIELDGIPLFMYVLSALQDVDDIGNIYVVGPKSKIEELLKKHTNPPSFPPFSKGGEGGFKKNVIAVEQRDNLYENIWHTFLASIDGYSAGDEYQNPSLMDKAVFVVAGDMPLITPHEIKEFLSRCDMSNHDYCIGMTPETALRYYYPSNEKMGIKLAYLHLKENRYRISNLHLVKPFKIANREYIEKIYEYRYQKDIKNIVKLTFELIRKHAGYKNLLFYIFVQMALFFSHIRLEFLSLFFRQFVSVKMAEGIVSNVLKTRLKLVETSFGGAALDVDNERDFNIIKVMHKEWMEYQKDRRQKQEVRSQKKNSFLLLLVSCILPLASCFLLLVPANAYAWGAGIHMKEGVFILDNLKLILPHIADILKAFPYDYLYGCISADIFIGKGHKRRDDHCHNWSIGQKMLKYADSNETNAFSYGYLSHLAADVIAHNFYIPNQLYLTSSTKRFGHIYWEFRSDEYIEKKYWKIAKTVINRHNRHNDEFMQDIIKKKIISFNTKKRLYSHSINVNDITLWQKAVTMVSKSSRWDVEKKYIEFLNRLSLNMVVSLLKNPYSSLCLKYDPVGTDNLTSSKRIRRIAIVLNGRFPVENGFDVPEEILKLNYV